MSRQITYSVIADGWTDRVLLPVISWAIHRLDPTVDILEPEFAERTGSVEEFFGDYSPSTMLVFAHRDAEKAAFEDRLREFEQVLSEHNEVVPVIPVRMSEAWLLIDGAAIAKAADAPGARVAVPKVTTLEKIADPKAELTELLFTAAGSPTGRSGKRFKSSTGKRRVNLASLITDYSPLESLSAFVEFQSALARAYPYPL